MQTIGIKSFGGPEQLFMDEQPDPSPGPHEVKVGIKATALNRADILQRQGKYPAPPGASSVLGLEMAGEVVEVGHAVSKWKVGDRVCSFAFWRRLCRICLYS